MAITFCCTSVVPTLKQLANIVTPKLAADWKIAAINLDFDASSIDIIRQKCGWDDPKGCCLEMLKEWQTKGNVPKTWEILLAALKKNRQLTNVCNEIETKVAEGIHSIVMIS